MRKSRSASDPFKAEGPSTLVAQTTNPVEGKRRGPRLCLAGSGGGHAHQLLGLERAWIGRDHFFITEDTALGRSIAAHHRTHFVAHFGLGQLRQGAWFRFLAGATANFFKSALIVIRERPDFLVTTGAGPMFFPLVWARFMGAKIIVVESLARFKAPSAFGRGAAPLAHLKIVQSERLGAIWPDAVVFDPLRIAPVPETAKRPFVFVTVGATLPFDRLIELVTNLKRKGVIAEDVLMQVGAGGLRPDGVPSVESLSYDEIRDLLGQADIVICHGGTGSIISALRHGCRVVAVPRSAEAHEVYDNHQTEIIEAFTARGLIHGANSEETLIAALERARAAPSIAAQADTGPLTDYLERLMCNWKPRPRLGLGRRVAATSPSNSQRLSARAAMRSAIDSSSEAPSGSA
jgi:UDP-N-acetylglucosamine transferase subunit ALG13